MIITQVKKIPTLAAKEYAWRGIAQFHNIEATTRTIVGLHQLSGKQISNARKQAEQIKYCLIQAKEYYNASATVSLATRPVLLYYCLMSLALAEILLKQSGNSRLSVLRANHNCHGLKLALSGEPGISDELATAAIKLSAKPQTGSLGEAKGTFEVWRRSAREYPTPGELEVVQGAGITTKYSALFTPDTSPPPNIPSDGVNLLEALTNLPYLTDTLNRWGCLLQMVRTHVRLKQNHDQKTSIATLAIHPNDQSIIEAFGNACRFHPDYANVAQFIDMPSGYIMQWNTINAAPCQLPHSTCIYSSEVHFACNNRNLGEFGYTYIAMHIMGNFARYYPDIWMRHIEANSPLANTIDDLCEQALTRLPILALSELTRVYHVIEK